MKNLNKKTAIVTGASSGIGYAISKTLSTLGYELYGFGRNFKNTDWNTMDNAHPIVCDILDTDRLCAELKQITAQNQVHVLVNNAGVSDSKKIEDYTSEHFANIMQLNVNAIMNAVMPVVKIMREQGGGCILNTSSMVSICGQPSGVAYPASKSAVNGLTWSLARELGPSGIRVNAVAPGITRTDMVAALPEKMIQPLINAIPLRRVGEPEDIANAFLFLASDMASYVTGEVLSVDGAMRA